MSMFSESLVCFDIATEPTASRKAGFDLKFAEFGTWRRSCPWPVGAATNYLSASRILPQADLPRDDDAIMQLVFKYLSDSEEDVRSGKTLVFGPALSFYQ
jgi:hypothetical protein